MQEPPANKSRSAARQVDRSGNISCLTFLTFWRNTYIDLFTEFPSGKYLKALKKKVCNPQLHPLGNKPDAVPANASALFSALKRRHKAVSVSGVKWKPRFVPIIPLKVWKTNEVWCIATALYPLPDNCDLCVRATTLHKETGPRCRGSCFIAIQWIFIKSSKELRRRLFVPPIPTLFLFAESRLTLFPVQRRPQTVFGFRNTWCASVSN